MMGALPGRHGLSAAPVHVAGATPTTYGPFRRRPWGLIGLAIATAATALPFLGFVISALMF